MHENARFSENRLQFGYSTEGVRSRLADLVFACIGPALEIFSRYSKVETAEGREVKLPEYLEKVWEGAKIHVCGLFGGMWRPARPGPEHSIPVFHSSPALRSGPSPVACCEGAGHRYLLGTRWALGE